MKITNSKGFTLIELLIVVAIIAILAAIAIPQFAQYRERGVRASMVADARNMATAEEAYYADMQQYGTLAAAVNSGGTGTIGPAATGVPIKMSKGNTPTVTIVGTGTSYAIVIANPAGGAKGNLTMSGGGQTPSSCAWADLSPC